MSLFICHFCGSKRNNSNSLKNHERCCPCNPDRKYKNGMTGKKGSNQFLKAKELGLPIPKGTMTGKASPFAGKKHSNKTKEVMSKKRSLNNKGGRSKWFKVNGIKVQGTWERDIAKILTEKKISWLKPTTARHSFRYISNDIERTYTPDFYLEEEDIYLEVKGHWWGNDKQKMQLVIEQNPEVNIKIIEKEEYERILDGELVW